MGISFWLKPDNSIFGLDANGGGTRGILTHSNGLWFGMSGSIIELGWADWSVVSNNTTCQTNTDGITASEVDIFAVTVGECKTACTRRRTCVAFDFETTSNGHAKCNLFDQVCTHPKHVGGQAVSMHIPDSKYHLLRRQNCTANQNDVSVSRGRIAGFPGLSDCEVQARLSNAHAYYWGDYNLGTPSLCAILFPNGTTPATAGDGSAWDSVSDGMKASEMTSNTGFCFTTWAPSAGRGYGEIQNGAYGGVVVQTININISIMDTAGLCGDACTDNSDCVLWVWRRSTGQCQLKDGSDLVFVADANLKTAKKNPVTTRVTSSYFGAWHHYALSYDAQKAQVSFFLDGFLKLKLDVPGRSFDSDTFLFGQARGDLPGFVGEMSEVQIVQRSLTEEDALAFAANKFAEAPLIYLKMKDIVLDFSGNDQNFPRRMPYSDQIGKVFGMEQFSLAPGKNGSKPLCLTDKEACSPACVYGFCQSTNCAASNSSYCCSCLPGFAGPTCTDPATGGALPATCWPKLSNNTYASLDPAIRLTANTAVSGTFSITAWVTAHSLQTGHIVMGCGVTSGSVSFNMQGERLRFEVLDANMSISVDAKPLHLEWHMLAGVVSHSAGTTSFSLFIDGVQVGQSQAPGEASFSALCAGDAGAVMGGLDDVRVFNRTLDAKEIKDIMEGDVSPVGLLLDVPFSAGFLPGLQDISPRNTSVTSNVPTWWKMEQLSLCIDVHFVPGSVRAIKGISVSPTTGVLTVDQGAKQASVSVEIAITPLVWAGLATSPMDVEVRDVSLVYGGVRRVINKGQGQRLLYSHTLLENDFVANELMGYGFEFQADVCVFNAQVCVISSPLSQQGRAIANSTINFAPPTIQKTSLRRFTDSGGGSSNLVAQSKSEQLAFGVTNFVNDFSLVRVRFGPLGNETVFSCLFNQPLSTSKLVVCDVVKEKDTELEGADLLFSLLLPGDLVVRGVDYYNFPQIPIVSSVSGCTMIGGKPTNCPTVGGPKLTVMGKSFVEPVSVTVGGKNCLNQVRTNATYLTCDVPVGAGIDQQVRVRSLGYYSNQAATISYASPIITKLLSRGGAGKCNQTDNDPLALSDCAREGNDRIAIVGSNLGEAGAIVIIGTLQCLNVNHTRANHTEVECTLPAGHQLSQPVLLVVAGGEVTESSAALSFLVCGIGYFENQTVGFPCVRCVPGTFAGEPGSVGACKTCPAGRFSKEYNQTLCKSCEPGRAQPGEGKSDCNPCKPGEWSGSAEASCVNCPVGKFQNPPDGCVLCAAGKIAEQEAQSLCSDCEPGRMSNEEHKSCLSCPPGQVSAQGSETCKPCPPQSYNNKDSTVCDCQQGYYGTFKETNSSKVRSLNDITSPEAVMCVKCPEGARCDQTGIFSFNVPAKTGWWHSSPDDLNFQQCVYLEHCAGEELTQTGKNLSISGGCGFKRYGLLCALCEEHYSSAGGKTLCVECPEVHTSGAITAFALIGLVAVIALGFYLLLRAEKHADEELEARLLQKEKAKREKIKALRAANRSKKRSGKQNESSGSETTSPPAEVSMDGSEIATHFSKTFMPRVLDLGGASALITRVALSPENKVESRFTSSLKILVSFFQITASLSVFDDVQLPTYFAKFISAFQIINLDFIPWQALSCVATFNFFTKMLLYGFVPIFGFVTFGVSFMTWVKMKDLKDVEDDSPSRVHRKKLKLQVWRMCLFALFLIYPLVSRNILQFFVCQKVGNEYYLETDFTIKCFQGEWMVYLGYAVFFVVVFPFGIPAAFLFLVWRRRHKLEDIHTVLQYGFLYQAYQVNAYWFEVVEMGHKLLLTGFLQFFDGAERFQFGMVITLLYTLVVIVLAPFVQHRNETLTLICEVEIFLLMLAGNSTAAEGNLKLGSFLDILLSAVMIAAVMFAMILFVAVSLHHARQNMWAKRRKKLAAGMSSFNYANASSLKSSTTFSPEHSAFSNSMSASGSLSSDPLDYKKFVATYNQYFEEQNMGTFAIVKTALKERIERTRTSGLCFRIPIPCKKGTVTDLGIGRCCVTLVDAITICTGKISANLQQKQAQYQASKVPESKPVFYMENIKSNSHLEQSERVPNQYV